MGQVCLFVALALVMTAAPAGAPIHRSQSAATSVDGKWTYRSYHNRPDLIGSDSTAALNAIFGEGIFTFDKTPDPKVLKGTFDMGGGYLLDLAGTVTAQTSAAPMTVTMTGLGRPGTPTDGWQYDYIGYLAWQWPNGVAQVPAIAGTVVRTKPHGAAKAGYVASFIAVKHP